MNLRRAVIVIMSSTLAALLVAFWPIFKQRSAPKTFSSKSDARSNIASPLHATKDDQGRLLPVNPNATGENKEPDQQGLKRIVDAYLTPITFYGEVVDENDAPIASASIKLMANDKPWGDSSVYHHSSDDQGLFSLHGARGAALSIDVSKDGYYSAAKSKGRFVYGGIRGDGDPPNPTSKKPFIFVLRKMGETEPLSAVDRDVVVPKNGQPVEINLRTGRAVDAGQGNIILECRTQNEGLDPNKNEPYDWQMRLSVPGGELIERIGEFSFIAPESGYRQTWEVNMPKNAEKWKYTAQGEFFIKTREGTYARLNLTMTTGGGHFVTIKAYLNPQKGSRNLELDPAKIIPNGR